jgi:hypothetical protein
LAGQVWARGSKVPTMGTAYNIDQDVECSYLLKNN